MKSTTMDKASDLPPFMKRSVSRIRAQRHEVKWEKIRGETFWNKVPTISYEGKCLCGCHFMIYQNPHRPTQGKLTTQSPEGGVIGLKDVPECDDLRRMIKKALLESEAIASLSGGDTLLQFSQRTA